MPKDSEYGDMTPERIKRYEERAKKYEMTDEEREERQRLIKEGKITITHINPIMDMEFMRKHYGQPDGDHKDSAPKP